MTERLIQSLRKRDHTNQVWCGGPIWAVYEEGGTIIAIMSAHPMLEGFWRLLGRSWDYLMARLSMSTVGFVALSCALPVTLYIALTAIPAVLDRAPKKTFICNLRENVGKSGRTTMIALGVWFLFWIIAIGASVTLTTYHEHLSLVAANFALNGQNTDLSRERDVLKAEVKKLKDAPPCPKATVRTVEVRPEPVTPEIKALRRDVGTDKDGLTVTEFTLTSNVAINPPLSIDMQFDNAIVYMEALPLPHAAAMLGGGTRWNGTHGFPTIPNTGINPNLAWIVTVKSRGPIYLTKPPTPVSGY